MAPHKLFLTCYLLLFLSGISFSQQKIDHAPQEEVAFKPLILNLNQAGSNYLRVLTWQQFQLQSHNLSTPAANWQMTPMLRRSRLAFLARLSSKVLIWTHIGMNSFTPNNMSPLGGEGYNAPQLFVHSAWGEVSLHPFVQVGAGLHYWNGMTRLASASTTSLMTMDQSRPFASWHTLGITDQYARHLGVYFKGKIHRLDYRLAFNAPSRNVLNDGQDYGIHNSGLLYNGVQQTAWNGQQTGSLILTGYIKYSFLDTESNLTPAQTGTYLGKKSVINIGGGFFSHPGGMYCPETGAHHNVQHFAVDFYLDKAVHNGNAIHVYAAAQRYDFGKHYVSRWVGTGHNWYGQVGYYFGKSKLMPYAAFQWGDYEGMAAPISTLDIGINYFIHGHNTKITLEYHRMQGDIREAAISDSKDVLSQLRMQLQLFL